GAEDDEEDDEMVVVFPNFGPNQMRVLKQQIALYDRYAARSVDDVMREISAGARKVNAIAVGDHDVYVACRAAKGYGFSVWTTDLKFEDPRQIVQGLVGCCGQMDVQATGDELWVAENSKHRVVQFDRTGKELMSFGKRDRDGVADGFGGCCNPMNLCFNQAGELLVSESNGVVKHFSKQGEYLGLIGVAGVQPGCKNSAIGVTADGERVFYVDIHQSKVIVLSRADAAPAE
ncbi:MAG TPA: hypothetical protein VGX78_10410, partial [Pirellulales bacterium]|nr:hypothetical protein [Pirellulales bacterium]